MTHPGRRKLLENPRKQARLVLCGTSPPVEETGLQAGTRASVRQRKCQAVAEPRCALLPGVMPGLTRSSAIWLRLPGAPGGRHQPVATAASCQPGAVAAQDDAERDAASSGRLSSLFGLQTPDLSAKLAFLSKIPLRAGLGA